MQLKSTDSIWCVERRWSTFLSEVCDFSTNTGKQKMEIFNNSSAAHKISSSLVQKWAFLVAQLVKNLPAVQETRVRSLGQEDPLEKEMATHSSTLAWRIPWTEESGLCNSPWGHKESDMTVRLCSEMTSWTFFVFGQFGFELSFVHWPEMCTKCPSPCQMLRWAGILPGILCSDHTSWTEQCAQGQVQFLVPPAAWAPLKAHL